VHRCDLLGGFFCQSIDFGGADADGETVPADNSPLSGAILGASASRLAALQIDLPDRLIPNA
jgi:hypothetical protein